MTLEYVVNIDMIARELDALGHELFGGVEDRTIDAACAALHLAFPQGYREFLRRYGAGYVSSESFIGLGGPPHLDVVRVANKLRAPPRPSLIPAKLIPILPDGGGNYECIDTSQPTTEGEFRIVFWRHDGGHNQVCEPVANSYLEWLWNALQAIKQEDAGGS